MIENSLSGAETLSSSSRAEFAKRRWILITNIPDGIDVEDLKQTFLHGYDVVDLRIEKNSGFVLLGTPDQAISAIDSLNGQSYHGFVVGLSLAPPDSLLFVGNMPFEFTEEQFRNLMSPFGPIERLLLVRSEFTGESKGYGFVDYINRDCALQAKQQLMTTGSKYVGGRILRIDFAEPNLLTYEDLHSKTLFVDKLPRDFTNGDVLREVFSQSGTVTFAQVAVNPQTGTSRGFAFVDYVTAEETERGQKGHNGASMEGSNIRVAYGTPGRTGASILGTQHSSSVGGPQHGPFNPRPRCPAPHVPAAGDMFGARGPRPLMAPRPLMGSEPWHQIPRALLGKSPRPLMRPGPPVPRPLLGRLRGPLFGPGVAPRPLLGRFPGSRPPMGRQPDPRGFVGVGPGGPPTSRSMAPRGGIMAPRPLMDFYGQFDGMSAIPRDQGVHVGLELSTQFVGESVPTPQSEPLVAGGVLPPADTAVYGQSVSQMAQQQEGLVHHTQQQGLMAPSQPQGSTTVVPQMVGQTHAPSMHHHSAVPQPLMDQFSTTPVPNPVNQVAPQSLPVLPVGYLGSSMTGTQAPTPIVQQPQLSAMLPAQQVPNNQVMYAPPQTNGLSGQVQHDQAQFQPGLVATPAVTGADPATAQYSVTAIPQMTPSDHVGNTAAVSQHTAYYTPQDTHSYPQLQYSVAGQVVGQQLSVPPAAVSVQAAQVHSSQPYPSPLMAAQTQQYQWYQAVASSVAPVPAVGSVAVSAQPLQTTPLQVTSVGGGQWPQAESVSIPSIMSIQPAGVYGQYQQPQQYQQQQQQQQQQQAQPLAPQPVQSAEPLVYYQQPQQGQYSGVIEASLAGQQMYSSVAPPTVEQTAFPTVNVAPVPQHSAAPVVYNTQQTSQLVPQSGHQQLSQKRMAEGDVMQYAQPGLPSYYDASKRPRF